MLLTRSQLAVRYGVSVWAVDKWRQRHAGFPKPKHVFGSVPVWDSDETDAWKGAR